MPTELENSIKMVADCIARYVQDVATLTVETRYVEIGNGGATAQEGRPAARTVIKLDADSSNVVPLKKSEGGTLEIDTALLQIHDRNVASAIDYRARMLSALLGILQSRIK